MDIFTTIIIVWILIIFYFLINDILKKTEKITDKLTETIKTMSLLIKSNDLMEYKEITRPEEEIQIEEERYKSVGELTEEELRGIKIPDLNIYNPAIGKIEKTENFNN